MGVHSVCFATVTVTLSIIARVTLSAASTDVDYTQYVLPFTGTQNGGNMFPGVARPFGVVKLGPDCYTGSDAYSGYLPTGVVQGFSMMHESGTGGAPKYGVVSQLPIVGNISNPLSDYSVQRSTADEAGVGYYKSELANSVSVELAATAHAGLLSYHFPAASGNASMSNNILVDVSHVLPSFRGQGLGQNYEFGNISIANDGHYEGSGIYNNGWNRAPDWTIYFCGRFNATASSINVFSGNGTTVYSYGNSTQASGDYRVGAVYTFADQDVLSHVGISWISSEKACQYIDDELPATKTFDDAVGDTKAQWNADVLSKITTTDNNVTNLQLLYTSMYGMSLLPSNRSGENPLWDSGEPYYDDIFTLWDLFRCHTPLLHILQPTLYEEYIRSLIDVWRNEGYMPDARSSNYNGRTQGGSNGDNVLADAYVKGVRGAVDWSAGYQALLKDATVTPNNTVPPDPMAPDSSTKEGRGALPDWIEYSYITPTFSRAVSRAVDYSVNDFGVSQVAAGLGHAKDAALFLNRSRNWRNHWNPAATSLGFSGFVVPRRSNGSFIAQDPLSCGGCYWGDAYYEALPWEYSFGVYHDVATLIEYCNGTDTFVARLDKFFESGVYSGNSAFGNTLFNLGNEPSFATPYLYNFAGRQDRSVEVSRYFIRSFYQPTVGGLPGNSDAGAMQAYLLWNLIGMYPLTGTTTFLVASPWLADLRIDLGGGKSLSITTEGAAADSFYVQGLEVNGCPWDKTWVSWHDVFAKGGTMHFVLGPNATNDWASGELPPSPAS